MIKHLVALAFSLFLIGPAQAAGGAAELIKRDWSFNGPFGTFDKASMQRGFQVYREVCAGCHSMNISRSATLLTLAITRRKLRQLPRNMK